MALTYVEKITALCPDLASPENWEGIRIEDTGSGPKIAVWSHSKYTQPTESAIAAVTQSDFDSAVSTYKQKRAAEYPSVVDQLDDIYHNGIDGWKATIKTTKDKYPKP
jgi:hypothetical protein